MQEQPIRSRHISFLLLIWHKPGVKTEEIEQAKAGHGIKYSLIVILRARYTWLVSKRLINDK